jgi:GTPase Era involved in 16S rRNA processing
MQEVPVRTHRLKEIVEGPKKERTQRINVRVGAELAHMIKRRVEVNVKVKVRKNASIPFLEQ